VDIFMRALLGEFYDDDICCLRYEIDARIHARKSV